MSQPQYYSYDLAFDRNIGWLTEWEQQALRGKRVAIAGMGGVGGSHLLTLARFGVGSFTIADLDQFELPNFNRQVGATLATIGRPKTEVLAEMALGINPQIRIRRFDSGIDPGNVDDFLSDVDLFIDGFDFFVLDIRRRVFARCADLGIPAVTAAPIGMGVGFLAFTPGGMSFEDYFRLEGRPEAQQYVRFLMGMAPRGLHRAYVVDDTRVDFRNRRAPSTIAACQLCAGVTAVAAVKLLLRRGAVRPAPYHHHFDPYLGKLRVTRLSFGNAGPLQRVKLRFGQRMFDSMSRRASSIAQPRLPASPLEEILHIARWAPSGDNTQPWRFRIVGDDTVILHLRDDSAEDLYDYRHGEPTLLSGGMLLESVRIAATAFQRRAEWHYDGRIDGRHRIVIRFAPQNDSPVDPLYSYLPLRSVDRRPYRLGPLDARAKQELHAALGDALELSWHEGIDRRFQMARLGAQATNIRLRIPETFPIHKRVIDWSHAQSRTGIPARAVGLNRPSLAMMRWAMESWPRMQLLNRFGGAFAAELQMDYLPGLASAGYFTVALKGGPRPSEPDVRMLLKSGESIQRFWITATKLGLAMQPAVAMLIFAHYGETRANFTIDGGLRRKAEELAASLKRTLGKTTDELLFAGRIGRPYQALPTHRSVRRSLDELIES